MSYKIGLVGVSNVGKTSLLSDTVPVPTTTVEIITKTFTINHQEIVFSFYTREHFKWTDVCVYRGPQTPCF